jgi:hypothetical protein
MFNNILRLLVEGSSFVEVGGLPCIRNNQPLVNTTNASADGSNIHNTRIGYPSAVCGSQRFLRRNKVTLEQNYRLSHLPVGHRPA